MTVEQKRNAVILAMLFCLLLCGGCKNGTDASADSSSDAPSETSSAPVYYVGGPVGMENSAELVEKEGLILPDGRFISKEEIHFNWEGIAVLPDGTTIIHCTYNPHGPAPDLPPSEPESQCGEDLD